jgi:F0F1-type ATP synthase membrane subunit c/vacuolar-type H+-ATPase subunit K
MFLIFYLMVDLVSLLLLFIAAAIAVSFAGIGPGIGRNAAGQAVEVLLVNLKLKENQRYSFIIFSFHGIFNDLWSVVALSLLLPNPFVG